MNCVSISFFEGLFLVQSKEFKDNDLMYVGNVYKCLDMSVYV